MYSSEFIRVVGEEFDKWFRDIARGISTGRYRPTGAFSFPNLLRVAETSDHLIAELCGAHLPTHPTQVRLKRPTSPERFQSATAYFNGGFGTDDASLASFQIGEYAGFDGFTFTTGYSLEEFRKKFHAELKGSFWKSQYSATTPLGIPAHNKKLYFRNTNIIRADGVRVIYRNIPFALCIAKDGTTSQELREWIRELCHNSWTGGAPLGLNLGCHSVAVEFSRQLHSLADQNVSEAILDGFLQCHGDEFRRALGYRAFLSQPQLKWIDKESLDPEVSIPDYLVQRPDGHWDILDLECPHFLCQGL